MNELGFGVEDERVMFFFERGAYFSGLLTYSIIDMHFSMGCYNDFFDMQEFELNLVEFHCWVHNRLMVFSLRGLPQILNVLLLPWHLKLQPVYAVL